MASIKQRRGRWVVRWRSQGRNRALTVPTKKVAAGFVAEILEAKARGQDWLPPAERPDNNPLIRDIAEDYIREKRHSLVRSTLTTYATRLETFLKWSGEIRASDLNKALVLDFLDAAERSAENAKMILRLWKWADQNEYPSVERFKDLTIRQEVKPVVTGTWDQMDYIISGAKHTHHRRILIMLRCTGLRFQQAATLTWDDIDLSKGWIHVKTGKTRREKLGRKVPIAPVLLDELKSWSQDEPLYGTQPMCRGTLAAYSTRLWQASGIDKEVWYRRTHHCFRKCFVTELKRAGANFEAVEVLVGHDTGITGVYTGELTENLVAAVALVPPINVRTRYSTPTPKSRNIPDSLVVHASV